MLGIMVWGKKVGAEALEGQEARAKGTRQAVLGLVPEVSTADVCEAGPAQATRLH
jgi:hypothetical protein